jgi:putative heme iron utilization protein
MNTDSEFEPKRAAKKLLREALSGALATLMQGSGDPYCSLVNVATAHDGSPLMLLSRLAVHTKNLLADSRASVMLDERKEGDPLERARLMLMGRLAASDNVTTRTRYLSRHPEAAQFASFTDFAIYRMTIERAHLVAGFGRIVDLEAKDIVTEVGDAAALIEAEPSAFAHMNGDHADALRLYATKLLGAPDGEWRCTGCDPEGLDLRLNRRGLRLTFERRVTTPADLRNILVKLADDARAHRD